MRQQTSDKNHRVIVLLFYTIAIDVDKVTC